MGKTKAIKPLLNEHRAWQSELLRETKHRSLLMQLSANSTGPIPVVMWQQSN